MEGPEAGVYYRGKGEVLEGEESVVVRLPSYVRNLATDFTVQITGVRCKESLSNHQRPVFEFSEVENNEFVVYGKGKFHWRVEGSRSSIDAEPLKNSVELKGDGPYKWI